MTIAQTLERWLRVYVLLNAKLWEKSGKGEQFDIYGTEGSCKLKRGLSAKKKQLRMLDKKVRLEARKRWKKLSQKPKLSSTE